MGSEQGAVNPYEAPGVGEMPRRAGAGGFYYGWVIVVVGAVAMAATLPGRTHGLGRITAHLLPDVGLDNNSYAWMNLAATLLGALFCLPCGWIIDRGGIRHLLGFVVAALGGTVIWMSYVDDHASLAVAISLTRGLGQSMLSVLSISLVTLWFQRRLGLAMGIYSVLMGVMMGTAMELLGENVMANGWRRGWFDQGLVLLVVVAPLLWLLARGAPSDRSLEFSGAGKGATKSAGDGCPSWLAALATPYFWLFAVAISLYALLSAGISLFQQYVLNERGFDEQVLHTISAIGPLIGMASNLFCGWLTLRLSLSRLLAAAMFLMAGALAVFPLVSTLWQVYAYTVVHGAAGGMITVLFFTVWGKAFGGPDLGRIQGAAQMMTVLASAAGPLVVEWSRTATGSYMQVFSASALVAAGLGLAACWLPAPSFAPAQQRLPKLSTMET